MFWFVMLLLLLGAGFVLFQKVTDIETEIRSEQAAAKVPEPEARVEREEDVVVPPVVTEEVQNMAASAEPVSDEPASLEDEILAAVVNLPGLKQTELYDSFADVNRKKLQQLLKEMDEAGQLKREKKGSSYLLFPV